MNTTTTEKETTTEQTAIVRTADAAVSQWEGTNLAGDVVEQGISKNRPEYQDDLRWWFRYAHVEKNMSQSMAAGMLGVDGGTYSKVFRGTYNAPQGGILPPPAKMLSRIRVMRAQEKEKADARNQGRVMTPTVEEIHWVCRKAWNDGQIAFIFGESHIGKSEAVLWFRDDNNHGATIYVDLQGCYGVQDVYRAFARALKISPDTPISKLVPRVMAAIDRTNLVICDEFHYLTYGYQKNGSVRMVNAIKAIKDRTGCAMVLIATNVARNEFVEGTGREAKLLKQLWRRGVIKLQLPDALRVGDVRAFAKTYDLEFPAAPEREDDDIWKKFRITHPDFVALDLTERIAHDYGIKHLVAVIHDGQRLAKKRGRALTWKDVIEAQRVYDSKSTKRVA